MRKFIRKAGWLLLFSFISGIAFGASTVGFPPFYLGMSLPEVEEILGKPETMMPTPDTTRMVYSYGKIGLILSFDARNVTSNEDFKLLTIMITKRNKYPTRKGIKVGDPFSKVKKLYGKPIIISTPYDVKDFCYDVENASLTFSKFKNKETVWMILLDGEKTCSERNNQG